MPDPHQLLPENGPSHVKVSNPQIWDSGSRIGFVVRLKAASIDYAIQLLVACGIVSGMMEVARAASAAMIMPPGHEGESFEQIAIYMSYLISLMLIQSFAAIYLLPEAVWGTSIGKSLYRLQITAQDNINRPRRLWARYLLKSSGYLINVVLVLPLFLTRGQQNAAVNLLVVSIVWSFAILISNLLVLRPSKQTLYDQLSMTVVVRKRIPPIP